MTLRNYLEVAVIVIVSQLFAAGSTYFEKPKTITVWDKGGYKSASLTYEEVYDLKRILRHEGLDKEKLNVLYTLKTRGIAVGWKDNSLNAEKREQAIKELSAARLIEQQDGIWVLSPKGSLVVAE